MMNKKLSLMVALGLGAVLSVACGGGAAPADPTTTTGATPAAGTTPTSASAKDPATTDTDGDGIMDAVDKCPDKKEDGQAPDVKDGCPKA